MTLVFQRFVLGFLGTIELHRIRDYRFFAGNVVVPIGFFFIGTL